ncbi:BgTH12-05163, partial [Blumeria graminis f. sp. triticale]
DPTVAEVNSKILQTYIAQRLAWYAEIEYTSGQLWELYRDDFSNWTLEMMKKCKVDILYLLRDSLTKNGVFVPRDSRKLAVRLLEVINEEQEHEWTQQEIEIQKNRGGVSLRNTIHPSRVLYQFQELFKCEKLRHSLTVMKFNNSNPNM